MGKISIIVPVYNAEETISRTIQSILAQTYIDFELILVNDGSTDKSLIVCNNFAKQDSRIKVINQENHGVSNARNTGLRVAKGDYFGFIDSDDWVDDNFYYSLIKIIEIYQADIVIGGMVNEFPNKKQVPFSIEKNILQLNSEEALECMLKNSPYGGFLCNRIYKKEIFAGIFLAEDIFMCEDVLISVDLFNRASNIVYFPKAKYHYYQSGKSMTTGKFSVKKLTGIRALEIVQEKVNKLYPNLNSLARHSLLLMKMDCCISILRVELEEKDFFFDIRNNIKKELLIQIFLANLSLRELRKSILILLPVDVSKSLLKLKKLINI